MAIVCSLVCASKQDWLLLTEALKSSKVAFGLISLYVHRDDSSAGVACCSMSLLQDAHFIIEKFHNKIQELSFHILN